MFGKIYLWGWSRTFVVGSFLITDLIVLVVIGQFWFSVSSWFILGRLYISRNLSIFPKLPNLLAYNCVYKKIVFSYKSFVFLWCQLLLVLYYFWFVYLGPLSFFLNKFGQRFVNFLYLFKEQVLGFNALQYFLALFYFHYDLIIFFLQYTSGIIYSFSVSSKCKVRLFIWDFSCFLR